MFDPEATPPAPSDAAGGGRPRSIYLLGRLRTRQITMDEATELFALMQAMLRSAQAQARAAPAGAPASELPAPVVVTAGGALSAAGEDLDWMMMLGLGLGAGLGAALIKRMHGEPAGRAAAPNPRSALP